MADGNGFPRDSFVPVNRGLQPTDLRHANQRAILTLIAVEAGLSNAELSRRTGLAPQTVSAVLVDLEEASLVLRGEPVRGKRGQPATPLFLNPRGAFSVGVEIGWNHVRVVLAGLGGQTLATYKRDYDYPDALTIVEEVAAAVKRVTIDLEDSDRRRIVGLGLAAPGGIGETSSLIPPPGIQSTLWADVDLRAAIAAATGLDVRLVNDGNAACWAEFVAHPDPRPQSFAYLLIDTFVAAGIIAESRLWEGVTGASANLGSMLVTDRQGASRFVHEIASIHALRQRLKGNGLDFGALGDGPAGPELQRVMNGWIEDAAFALAQAILNAATVLEYEVAIIEAVLPPGVSARLVEAVNRHVLNVPSLGRTRPRVIGGHIGGSGAAKGAALLRMYHRFFSRELQHMSA